MPCGRACASVLACLLAGATAALCSEAGPQPPGVEDALPWAVDDPQGDVARAPRQTTPREMLELFRIDESQIRQLEDGRRLASDEEETVVRILYRIPDFGLDRIHAWCTASLPLAEIPAETDSCRLQFFPLRGRATALQVREIPGEAATRLGFDRFYIVRVQAGASPRAVRIVTRNVPSAWLSRTALDERVGCCGLLLKSGEGDAASRELYFAAERIAWYPDREDPELGVTSSCVLLGELGMDVGLFDRIRKTNRAPLRPEDGEAFYQMLSAVERARPEALQAASTGELPLQPMLDQPETQQGRLVTVRGTARRVQKVLVGDPAIQSRFGLEEYYQVDVFVPLGDLELQMRAGEGEHDVAVFSQAFPVNLCVPELPDGLGVGENLSVEVRTSGFYFKLWAYRTEFISAVNPARRQVGPLLIAATPELVPPRRSGSAFWGILGGSAFLAALLGLGFWGWLYRRSDQRFQRDVLRPRILDRAKEARS